MRRSRVGAAVTSDPTAGGDPLRVHLPISAPARSPACVDDEEGHRGRPVPVPRPRGRSRSGGHPGAEPLGPRCASGTLGRGGRCPSEPLCGFHSRRRLKSLCSGRVLPNAFSFLRLGRAGRRRVMSCHGSARVSLTTSTGESLPRVPGPRGRTRVAWPQLGGVAAPGWRGPAGLLRVMCLLADFSSFLHPR